MLTAVHGTVSLAVATDALREGFPGLAGLEVRVLGEGTDNLAVLVGNALVFRFPKRDDAAEALARELAVLPRVAPRLPIAAPDYRYVGRAGRSFPRLFAGYPLLVGEVAARRELGDAALVALGRALGGLLRVLHGERDADALDLAPEDDARDEWQQEALADLASAELPDDARAWTAQALAVVPEAAPARCLVHGDLAAEHVLVDAGGRATGVLDWTDLAFDDPARDFAGLAHWGGAPMLAAALAAYGPTDAGLVARARWFAVCRAAGDLAFGAREGRPEYVALGRRALRLLRAFDD